MIRANAFLTLALCLGCSWVEPPRAVPKVRINELVATGSELVDEDGEAFDWIELHNPSSEPVSLAGWSLADNPRRPGQWTFPEVTLPAGGYLLIRATGKDRRRPGRPLHTNFRLSSKGEYLGLFSGPRKPLVVSEIAYGFPVQRAGYSYGWSRDASRLGYLHPGTPGTANPAETLEGRVRDASMSPRGGRFSHPVQLQLISRDPKAEIRFTLDGSDPTRVEGTPYTEPLTLKETTVVRARAFLPGALPSRIVTSTYFVDLSNEAAELPWVSMVVDPDDLHGPQGVLGMSDQRRRTADADSWSPREHDPPEYYNPLNRGRAWERPASIEYLPQEAAEVALQFDCGFRVSGSDYHRARLGTDARPSFRLLMRASYGQEAVTYPFFPGSSRQTFQRLALRRPINATQAQIVRDELARRLWSDMGYPSPRGSFVRRFLNGVDHGACLLVERLDGRFLSDLAGQQSDWDVVQPRGLPRDGDEVAWDELLSLAPPGGLPAEDRSSEIASRVDLTSFVDYLLLEMFVGNLYWPDSNWVAVRQRKEGSLFRFFVWDSEGSFGYKRRGLERDLILTELQRVDVEDNELPRLFRALLRNTGVRLIAEDANWRYFKGLREPPPDWLSSSFDASGWLEGPGGFGYGDRDDRTSLEDMKDSYGSLYLHHRFHVEDPERLSQLLFNLRYDDAVVVYLNGQEVLRSKGLEGAGSPPAHDVMSETSHEATRARRAVDLSELLPLLQKGSNVLAVQVHNRSLGNSDLSFEAELSAYVHDLSDPFRKLFASRVRRHLFGEGALTTDRALGRFEEIAGVCESVMPEFDQWEDTMSIREEWLPQRRQILLRHLRMHGLADPMLEASR